MENRKKNNKNVKNIVMIVVAVIVAIAVIAVIVFASTYNRDSSVPGDDSGAVNGTSDNSGTDDGPDDTSNDEQNTASGENNENNENSENSDNTGNNEVPSDSGSVQDQTADTPNSADTPDDSSSDTDAPAGSTDPDDEEDPDTDLEEGGDDPLESELVVEPGTSEWPASLPSDIPAFKGALSFSNNCIYEKHETQEVWYMGWDASVADYDTWMDEITDAGFVSVTDIYGYYVNGEYLLDITTEDVGDGNTWVSMDVYHAMDVVYPQKLEGVIPAFDLASTLEFWHVDEGKSTMTLYYVCPADWGSDITILGNVLASAGFTVSDANAKKTVDGYTVTVKWSGANHQIIITY